MKAICRGCRFSLFCLARIHLIVFCPRHRLLLVWRVCAYVIIGKRGTVPMDCPAARLLVCSYAGTGECCDSCVVYPGRL
jgi:hypothetical protein